MISAVAAGFGIVQNEFNASEKAELTLEQQKEMHKTEIGAAKSAGTRALASVANGGNVASQAAAMKESLKASDVLSAANH
jgi:hypothetical protein